MALIFITIPAEFHIDLLFVSNERPGQLGA